MKHNILLPLAIVGLTFGSVTKSNAAIILTNSVNLYSMPDPVGSEQAPRLANGANLSSISSSFDLTGGNAVAVMFTGENANAFSATFDGVTMTVVNILSGVHYSGIAYLINPTATIGNVVISATNSGSSRLSYAYSIVALSDVASLAGSDNRTGNGGLSYTTALDDGYVLAAAVNNNYQGPSSTVSGGNIDSTLLSVAVDGNQSTLFAHGDVTTAGSYTETFGGGVFSASVLAFEAAVVPEPTTTALLGLGGLALILRRRR